MKAENFRIIYWVILPLVITSAIVLGYLGWKSAKRYQVLGHRSLVQSTVLLVDEKVGRIEDQIIKADNSVFSTIDMAQPEMLEQNWVPLSDAISPWVDQVAVIDLMDQRLLAAVGKSTPEDKEYFLQRIYGHVWQTLSPNHLRPNQLGHLHDNTGKSPELYAYKKTQHEGREYFWVLRHNLKGMMDSGYFEMFLAEQGDQIRFQIVDDAQHLVLGPKTRSVLLGEEYVVSKRFPSTFYLWRFQGVPPNAKGLEQEEGSKFAIELGVIIASVLMVVMGLILVVYATVQNQRLQTLRTEFVANVSHELKTPLSVVRMFSELLYSGKVPTHEKRQEYLKTISKESERLSLLIDNVLDFSSFEKGISPYHKKDADLLAVLKRAIDALKFRYGDDVVYQVDAPDNLEPVRMDEQAVLLAVINLIDNAVKYSAAQRQEEEKVKVEIAVKRGRRHLYIHVRDHGPGIPAEDLKRVFERFYRVPPKPFSGDHGNATRGSGIGLALVKRIAEAHQGKAWAENIPEHPNIPKQRGAMVSFSLLHEQANKA